MPLTYVLQFSKVDNLGMVSHGYNASTQENEQEDSYEFKASLDYKVNSRTALDTMSPDLKTKQQKARIL